MSDDFGNLVGEAAPYIPAAIGAYSTYKRYQPFIKGTIDASQGAHLGAVAAPTVAKVAAKVGIGTAARIGCRCSGWCGLRRSFWCCSRFDRPRCWNADRRWPWRCRFADPSAHSVGQADQQDSFDRRHPLTEAGREAQGGTTSGDGTRQLHVGGTWWRRLLVRSIAEPHHWWR